MITKARQVCDQHLSKLGLWIAKKLHARSYRSNPPAHVDFDKVCQALRPGDVLLVEGNERISGAIKYLTQSTWSHAAFFVGDALDQTDTARSRTCLIEVNLHEGCVTSPLSKYDGFNLRICRAPALSDAEWAALITFMEGKIGLQYDLRNIFDLLRYFMPTLPMPAHWRRRMLAVGSGDPTRAICSSLIAQAFQSINYPILPVVSLNETMDEAAQKEIYHIRHHSLFAPRDFDLSPYFEVIKPTLGRGFDFHDLVWDKPVLRK